MLAWDRLNATIASGQVDLEFVMDAEQPVKSLGVAAALTRRP